MTEFSEGEGAFSPDGRWVAYSSNESGKWEIYVRSFDDPNRRPVKISSDGGSLPRWRSDGAELFYISAPGEFLMAVPVKTGPPFEAGTPQPLFEKGWGQYDVSADGQRFLFPTSPTKHESVPITVVLNWMAELDR